MTHFDPASLFAHCHSDSERQKRRVAPITWDSSTAGNLLEVDYAKAQSDPAELLHLLDAVKHHGICLIRNVSAKPEATEQLAGLIGHMR